MAASEIAQWRRVIVVDGAVRREMLLSSTDALRDSLRNEGLDLGARRVLVLTADGSEVDVEAAPVLSDGALLTVVDLSAVRRSAMPEARSGTNRAGESTTLVWFTVAAFALLAAVAGALGSDAGGVASVVRIATVTLLVVLAVVCVPAMAPGRGGFSLGIVVVPGALAFAAGFLAVPGQLADSAHLGGFVGLLAAAIAQTAVHARVAAAIAGGATGLIALSLTVLAATWGITLLLGLGAPVAAALAAGFAPLALRVLPFLVIDVPEGQLLEYATFKQNKWTVREVAPPPSHPVTSAQMASTMSRAHLQYRAGTVVFSLVPAVVLPFLLLDRSVDPVANIGTIVLCAVIVASLTLSPRQANGAVQRWTPRIGAALVAIEFALVAVQGGSSVAILFAGGVVVLVGLAVAAISVPIRRGSRSLGVSRFADIIESLTTALAFPAAVAAAGLIDLLRGTVS